SRSSALASKATGYPIAKIAAKIAIGMTLDEIKNPITGTTYACFEPTVDYVVTKIPRWPFDKFRTIDTRIGTQMKSTGEVMAIGRNIEESLQKAIRSLEIKKFGLSHETLTNDETIKELKTPTHKRIFYIAEALRRKMNVKKISELTGYNKFFIQKIKNIVECEENLKNSFSLRALLKAKKLGCSDKYIAEIIGTNEDYVRSLRTSNKILPDYKIVDTCAGEFDAKTPYYYSTYELGNANKALCKAPLNENDVDNKKVAIIGSGAIRIGQGIEFDYCSVHAAFALKENGIETIMINNNPETVSTDFDTSTRLYFEPLTFEDAMNVIEHEKPFGIIVQLGGQTSINLGMPIYNELKKRNLKTKILGTSPEAIDIAEDRELFEKLMKELEILRPPASTGYSFEEVKRLAYEIGYPVLIRPSYVLGGRAMEIVYNEEELREYMEAAVEVSEGHPVLIDKFLTNAIEVDVDAICDGKDVFIGGILEHIEEAGVHSGDASMVMPPQNLSSAILKNIKNDTKKIALALNTVGLINIQFAVQNCNVYVIEANP
ncbi:MAG: carbamoyl-phosphate synthase large subunit, partial [Candidatus Thermoplasmatota archaeon]